MCKIYQQENVHKAIPQNHDGEENKIGKYYEKSIHASLLYFCIV